MRKFLSEPLVHFLFGGLLLFVFYNVFGNSENENTITVDKQDILNFMQYQSKAFNKDVFETKLDKLPDDEKEQLINNYVQDEVLYREALKLGLDQNDYVIKRRIIQKMEFILDDFDADAVVVNEDSLIGYYEQHKHRYHQPALFTFSHIYFKNTPEASSLERAALFMKDRGHQKLSSSESLRFGDRFLYHRNYAEKSLSFLESQFGTEFVQELMTRNANPIEWQGPIPSVHGAHYILLTNKQESRIPELGDIRNQVKSDYLIDLKKQYKQKQIAKEIDEYDVKIEWN